MDRFPILGQPDTGDTAWMLASSALVLLMTPGLAFFYGGMVRAKGVLNMLMMSISAMGVVTVLWVLYGYSMSFGNDVAGLFGNPTQYWGLKGLIHGNAVARRCHSRRRCGRHSTGRHNPPAGVRDVPADVRHHHCGVGLRCGRRPAEIRQLAGLRGAMGDLGLLPGCTLGVFFRRVHRSARRLDREQTQSDRLRRWHCGPHQLGRGRSGVVHRSRQAQGLADVADAAAQPAVRDARCRPAVVRVVRVQRRLRRSVPVVPRRRRS